MVTRNIIEVINKIKPIYVEQGLDTSELDSIITSKEFAPPELDQLHWQRLQEELNAVAEPHWKKDIEDFPDWLKQISNIVLGKE